MKIVLFYHSLLSCWSHPTAHFLRGIVRELLERGHQVQVFEPRQGWSLQNLLREHGTSSLDELRVYYPGIFGETENNPEKTGTSTAEILAQMAAASAGGQQVSVLAGHVSQFYDPESVNLDTVLANADLVVVHDWNDPELIKQLGKHRARNSYKLLFHHTHHHAATAHTAPYVHRLQHYDGVLASGKAVYNLYAGRSRKNGLWTWHEAADTSLFYPRRFEQPEGDLIWIGNWGTEDRTTELHEFLIKPVKELGLKAKVYGVRYPEHALQALADAGIAYGGWLPNYKAPQEFARYKVTVHVPATPNAQPLSGTPSIRLFEALASGIPLVSAPWQNAGDLFTPGKDFLVANTAEEMKQHLASLIRNGSKAEELSQNGLATIRTRHTCCHRVNELEDICEELGINQCKIYPTARQPASAEIMG